MIGYDRPLDYFFMSIENIDTRLTDSDDDDLHYEWEPTFLYSNIDDEDEPFKIKDLGIYMATLAEMQITLPPAMIARLEQDMIEKPGNIDIDFTEDEK